MQAHTKTKQDKQVANLVQQELINPTLDKALARIALLVLLQRAPVQHVHLVMQEHIVTAQQILLALIAITDNIKT
jgi:hypothetical protein